MKLIDALQVDHQVYVDALANGRPASRDVNGSGVLAIYDKKSNAGKLLGVIEADQWVLLLEADAKVTRLEGDSLNEDTDEIHETVKAGNDHRRERLERRKAKLEGQLADVIAKLG